MAERGSFASKRVFPRASCSEAVSGFFKAAFPRIVNAFDVSSRCRASSALEIAREMRSSRLEQAAKSDSAISRQGAIRLRKTMSFFRCIIYITAKGAESQVIARILLMESLFFVGSISPVAIHHLGCDQKVAFLERD